MGKISEIKMQLRHKEWAEMVSECQASGKKVDEWCRENGINVSTYYKRQFCSKFRIAHDLTPFQK